MTLFEPGDLTMAPISGRAGEIYGRQLDQGYRAIDRLFAVLLPLQWLAAVLVAWLVSPYTWVGEQSWVHAHVWAALFLGGLTVSLPVALIALRSGRESTRLVIGVAQMLLGSLLIHLSGGRPETHFHVFGSLAFLALYCDWRVLVTASGVVALDHYLRGVYWPRSIFGYWGVGPWRWAEHAAWVLFEDAVLLYGCTQKLKAFREIAWREAELEANHERIEQAVEKRTAELGGANESLRLEIVERRKAEDEALTARAQSEAASRAKGEFLANMSHEIRTPMNGVLGMTELALQTELLPIQREYLETVQSSAEAMLTVINDILDFSKIEAGKIDLDLIPFNIHALIDETLPILAARAHDKGVELACRIAPSVAEWVLGDPHRLRQVLINLVGNAIKFTAEGEVVVTVEPASSSLGEGSDVGQEVDLIFNITDSGIGIATEKLHTIFEPFEQADGSTTRKFGGTGLGLTISMQLVSLMGGRIWVESELGKGSRFWFNAQFKCLQKPSQLGSKITPADLKGRSILVVDDNTTTLKIIGDILKHWGVSATLADSGESALGKLLEASKNDQPIRLALIDRLMPGMSGMELAEQIRARPELAGMPLVMLTAAPVIEDEQRRRDLGIQACLSKPVRLLELFEALTSATSDTPRSTTRSDGNGNGNGNGHSTSPSVVLAETDLSARVMRILLVEDHPINQKVACRMIERLGHDVTVANNGREALEVLEVKPFDLVLMDLQMPEMDGFQALQVLRAREIGQPTRLAVVALTAHAMKGDRELCLDRGFDDYLTKPIRSDQFAAVLGRQMACSFAHAAVGTEEIPTLVSSHAFTK